MGSKSKVSLVLAAAVIAMGLTVAAVANGPAPLPDGTAMGTVPGVTNLTPDQQRQITQIRQDTQRQVQSIRRDTTLTPEQRELRIRQVQEQQHQQVLNVLTPQQRQDFNNWWTSRYGTTGAGFGAGPGAGMMTPGFVPGVTNLTTDQQQEITQIRQETRQQVQSIRRDTTLTATQRDQQIQQLRESQHQRVMDVLTPQQRQEFQTWWDENFGRSFTPGTGAGVGAGPMDPGYVPGVMNLTADQQEEIAQIRQETRQQVMDIQMDTTLTSEQREQQIMQLQYEQHQQVMDVLTPQQRQEFQTWWGENFGGAFTTGMGAGVGAGPMAPGAVPGVMNLSSDQQQEIAQIRQATRQRVQNIQMDTTLTPEQRQQQIMQACSEQHEQIMNVMTPTQRQEFMTWWNENFGCAMDMSAGVGAGPASTTPDYIEPSDESPMDMDMGDDGESY